MSSTVDIRPTLGDTLKGYQRLSYKPETAIAEFVDNSTASFYDHEALFDLWEEKLLVDIHYDRNQKVLVIADNAWGMDRETFADALTIAKRPKNQRGRNEYGMGMKTAASWFGNKWTVITKARGADEEYTATVDIEELLRTKGNEIHISTKHVDDQNSHYTIIQIADLTKQIRESALTKLTDSLANIYRSDINSGKITIRINGNELSYDLPEILTETIDGIEKVWRKDFEDTLIFDGRNYDFRGFVAIRKIGNYKKTGFALLRRGRVILAENEFKPSEIFGSDNSYQSLRIFGEVHMDDWPVTQAKDKFDWDLDGLKEAFIDKLKELTEDYILKAKVTRKKEKEEFVHVTIRDVEEIAKETHQDLSSIEGVTVEPESEIKVSQTLDAEQNSIPSYATTVCILGCSYNIKVSFICDPSQELIKVDDLVQTSTIEVTFNTAHPYFEKFKDQDVFIKVFQRYMILHIIAEKYLTHISTNQGRVYPFEVREVINRMLEEIKNKPENEIFK